MSFKENQGKYQNFEVNTKQIQLRETSRTAQLKEAYSEDLLYRNSTYILNPAKTIAIFVQNVIELCGHFSKISLPDWYTLYFYSTIQIISANNIL